MRRPAPPAGPQGAGSGATPEFRAMSSSPTSSPPAASPPVVHPGDVLCRLDDLVDPPSKAFLLKFDDGEEVEIFVVRQGDSAYAYVNECPHQLLPLNWKDDVFLTLDGSRILCVMHGATFGIDSGAVLSGPMPGDCALMKVPVTVADGEIRLAPRHAEAS
jgi:nitrite reductase/ring-hydroxylating ferredoxin subunit